MQLTKPSEVRKESVIFLEPKTDKHGNESIKIKTKYSDNKTGPLVIETPFLFSFGVNERKSLDSDELVGYTLPVCLWGKGEEPTPSQSEFLECLTNLQEFCHEYLEETYGSDVCERLRDILYYKMTTDKKGRKKRDEDNCLPPVLYAKLIYSGKYQMILSLFRTKESKISQNQKSKLAKAPEKSPFQGIPIIPGTVDPMLYFEKYCTVKMALIIESIYISDEYVSIQIKVNECYVKPQRLTIKPLLTISDSDSDEETE